MDGFIRNKNEIQNLANGFLDAFLNSTQPYCEAYLNAVELVRDLENLIGADEKIPEQINDVTEKLVFAESYLKKEEEKRDLSKRMYINLANRYDLDINEDFNKLSNDYNVLKSKYHSSLATTLQKLGELSQKDKKIKSYAEIFNDIDPVLFDEGRKKCMMMQADEREKETARYFEKIKAELQEGIDRAYQ